jgi:enterochelin esterase-like enzyme
MELHRRLAQIVVRKQTWGLILAILLTLLSFSVRTRGQAAQAAPNPNATLVSIETSSDHMLTFRVYAPKAQDVELRGDYKRSENASSAKLTRGDNGVWSVTVGPAEPGTYRYTFVIDGVQTVDPKGHTAFERLDNVWSLVTVPGAEFQDEKADVPHGTMETVWYPSATLGRMRRMHIYTPASYRGGQQRYPVLYLLHSAAETDEGWPTEGRLNIIMDNMIAANRVKPMIVVMPAGEVNAAFFRDKLIDDVNTFDQEFVKDIVPYVEKNYRVIADRQHRAFAGASMGGMEMLQAALLHLDQVAYVGIFSSGWFEHGDIPFVKDHEDLLSDAAAKRNLKLLWSGVGRQDMTAYEVTQQMLKVLRAHGFTPEYDETEGAHNWITWRDYLITFTQKIF